MKLLFIGHSYIVKMNRAISEYIAKDFGWETYIITPRNWKNILIKNFKVDNNEKNIFYLNVRKSGNMKRYTYKNLLPVLKEIEPEIIYIAEEPWFRSTFQIVLLSTFLRKKPKIIIFTWENIYKKFKLHYKLIEKFNIRKADLIIAGNKEAKRIMKQKGVKAPIFILPHIGVNIEDYHYKKIESKNIRIAYIGRIVKEKGILLLIEAFKKLPFKNKKLLIVGNGPLLSELKYINNNNIKFIEGVPHHKVPELFRKIDILVLPSYSTENWKEQFGHILIEAMAARVPTIASNCGAIPEVIDKAGLIFKEGDVNDLYEKLYKLIKSKRLRDFYARKGLQRVEKYYTNKILAEKLYQICKEIKM